MIADNYFSPRDTFPPDSSRLYVGRLITAEQLET